MSTTVTPLRPDPYAKFRGQVAELTPELGRALPSHIKPERFARVILTVCQQQPDLLNADRRSLFASCLKCASDGLIPDGREAALVIFNTKRKVDGRDVWVKAVQYMPMMAGLLKRIRNSAEIASVQAHIIYANDTFLIRRGLTDTLEHTPLFPGERGKPVGAYALAKFKDGSDPQFEVMDLSQIDAVAKISRSRDKQGNPYGPWKDHWDEMARKTVFRRLAKWLPMDADTETVMRRDDEAGTLDASSPTIDAVVGDDQPAQIEHSSKLDSLEGELLEGEPVTVNSDFPGDRA